MVEIFCHTFSSAKENSFLLSRKKVKRWELGIETVTATKVYLEVQERLNI